MCLWYIDNVADKQEIKVNSTNSLWYFNFVHLHKLHSEQNQENCVQSDVLVASYLQQNNCYRLTDHKASWLLVTAC